MLYDGPILVDEEYLGSAQICHVVGPAPSQTPTPTPNVVSVTLSQVTPSSEPISQNPQVLPHNPGIGQRIFPDDDTPGDTVDRRLVRVTATLSQPVQNVEVYFRSFDLDDPSIDTTIDPPTPPGVTGDNRGMPNIGQLVGKTCRADGASVVCPTNASGIATVNFIVTQQPGDNFAVAAGTSPVQVNAVGVNGIELIDSGGQNIPISCTTQAVCRSQMLTVWRRLHIEVDSMRPSINNYVLGTIPAGFKISPNQTRVVTLNRSPNEPLEVNRFQHGRLAVGFRSLAVESNTATTVTIRNRTPGAISIGDNSPFQLYDDDDFDNLDTFLDGDTGEDIPMLQRTLVEDTDDSALNRLAAAYIRPKYDIGDNNDATDFFVNVSADTVPAVRDLYDFDQVATEADPSFWTLYLLSAYQHVAIEDGDPDDDDGDGTVNDATVGISDRIPDANGVRRGHGAVVFFEASSFDECFAHFTINYCDISTTKLHEIGHQLGAEHGDGGVMDNLTFDYSPTTIRSIRGRTYP